MPWVLKRNLTGPRGYQGIQGSRGLPGLNGVATDDAVAEYLRTRGTQASNAIHYDLGKILVMGDSIGTGAFPYWMQEDLFKNGYASDIVNESVGGNTTTVLLSRLPDLLATHAPKHVLFMVSINDQRVDVVHSTETSVSNVRAAVDLIRKAGAVPIIVGSAHIDPAWASNPAAWTIASAQSAVVTNRAVKGMCDAEEVLFVDVFDAMLRRIGVLSDGVHPNEAGSIVWGRACADAIAERQSRSTRKVLLSDSFTRPNSATVLGAATWLTEVGTWGVVDNAAYSATAADGDQVTANVGANDYAVMVKTAHAGDLAWGIPFRYTNSTNYLLLTVETSGMVRFLTRIGGTFASFTSNLATFVGNDEVVIHAEGNHLMAFVNGMPILSFSQGTFLTGPRVGVRQSTSALARFDKFIVSA